MVALAPSRPQRISLTRLRQRAARISAVEALPEACPAIGCPQQGDDTGYVLLQLSPYSPRRMRSTCACMQVVRGRDMRGPNHLGRIAGQGKVLREAGASSSKSRQKY